MLSPKVYPLVRFAMLSIVKYDILNRQFMKNKKDEFYRAEDLAEKLKVHIMTIYRYIKAGRLKAYKIGKEFRIDKKEFERFLNSVKTK